MRTAPRSASQKTKCSGPETESADDPVARERAERELWSWYLEWSGQARMAVKDRRVLRALGFLRSGKKKEDDADDA